MNRSMIHLSALPQRRKVASGTRRACVKTRGQNYSLYVKYNFFSPTTTLHYVVFETVISSEFRGRAFENAFVALDCARVQANLLKG